MYVLGISAFYHDSAAALVAGGVPVACVQEERFTRRRHDPAFPKRAVRYCLREAGITARDLERVVFYEKPLRKFERVLVTQMRGFPRAGRAFSRAMFQWLGDRLWIKNRIATELGCDPERVHFTEHQRSHAASAFYPSPFDEAAILTVDGVGEWATTCLAHGRGGEIEILGEVHFPHSLGLFYSAITSYLGFEVPSGERQTQAMAAFGEPRYEEALSGLVRLRDDGSFELDLAPFRFHFDHETSFGKGLEKLLGPARAPGEGGLEQRHFDVAASLQRVTEKVLLGLARQLRERVPSDHLCLAGALALNADANAAILRDGPFRRLFVPPAPADAGGALGAALEIHHRLAGAPRAYRQRHAFLGEEVPEAPRDGHRELAGDAALVAEMTGLLAGGKTVGWVRGRGEWGGRSLGHRSLLADPRDPETGRHLRRDLAHGEDFLPFAAAVPIERAGEFFVVPEGGRLAGRFLLLSMEARRRARAAIPAAVHRGGSARVQLVDPEVDPLFHRLLTAFGDAAGVPVLLNGSLHLRGEPMVRGEADALALFDRTPLDALVVESRLYLKEPPAGRRATTDTRPASGS